MAKKDRSAENAESEDQKAEDTLPEAAEDTASGVVGETLSGSDDTLVAEDAVNMPDVAEPTPPEADDTLAASETDSTNGTGTTSATDDILPENDTGAGPLSSDADDRLAADTPDMAEPATEAQPAPVAPPQVIKETVVQRKGGFFPMLLGGLVAAVLGFGAAKYSNLPLPGFLPAPPADPFQAEARAALDAQASDVAALAERVDMVQASVAEIDLEPLTAAVAGLEDSLATAQDAIAALGDQVAAFDSRLTAIEKQPLAEALSPEAVAAYERELDDLRQTLETQRQALEDTVTPAAITAIEERLAEQAEALNTAVQPEAVSALQDEIAALQTRLTEQDSALQDVAADTQEMIRRAEEQAALVRSVAAIADLGAAVQAGDPYAEPLSVMQENGLSVPDVLVANAATGVPSQQSLTETFPALARRALSLARDSGAMPAEDGFGGFLRSQLGARSVAPREGDDPDAVLSRAEAAVKAGDLGVALEELTSLPADVRAVFDDWTAQAELRADALSAAARLAQETNLE